jgi:uncharacterized protein
MNEGKIIFKCRTGSHLYGLNNENSDEDFVGVFLPNEEYILGLKSIDEIDNSTKKSSKTTRNTKDDIDEKLYSINKYLHLCLQNNPNIVELLFTDKRNEIIMTDEWSELKLNFDKFISKRVYHTFKGYAFSQKKKLTVKRDRYNSLGESISNMKKIFSIEELNDPKRGLTEFEASELNKTLKYYKGEKNNCESFHKGMHIKIIYEKLKYEYENYGWRVKTDTFLDLGYDVKFGYNLIRILVECKQILKTGQLTFPITGNARNDILRIRKGEVESNELLKLYEKYEKECDDAYETTKLTKSPNFNWVNKWLIKVLKNHIR